MTTAITTTPPRHYITRVEPGHELGLRDFCTQHVDGHTMSSIANASGVAYSTIFRHVEQKLAMSVKNAVKLEKWSKGRIKASKTLGVA